MPKVNKPLKVLFPEESVTLPDGSKVIVKPLSLKDFPKLIKSFGKVASEISVKGTMTQSELGMEMIAEIASEILPACIDRDPADIPFQCAPEVIDLVLDQNFTGDAVKKWSALAQKIPGLASVIVKEDGKGSASDIPSQSKTSKE